MTSTGFRILPVKERAEKKIIDEFKNIVTPHISDNLNRMFAGGTALRPFHKRGKLVGSAITVKTRPGDNLMVHKAIDLAEPGDVIVVDAGGDLTNAIVGEIMLRIAQKNKISGFIINGAIRDTVAFAEEEFPVYAAGVTHRGPYKDGPGEINVPISLSGMIVNPGDIMVGDEDGLVTVPLDRAEEILALAQKHQKMEEEIMKSIYEGTIDRSWIDKTLTEKGCEVL